MARAMAVKQTFAEHVYELRGRLLIWILTLLGASAAAYVWREPVFDLLTRPLNQQLYYTSPGGGFLAFMTISLLVGFVVSVPVLIWQFIRFIEPAMPGKLGKRVGSFVAVSMLLGLSGAAFAYKISLPATLNFLNSAGGKDILPLILANDYLHFLVGYLGGFALAFQLPIVMLVVNKISPLSRQKLNSYRRYFIVFAVLFAAVLTPTPDPVNQFIMAAPMLLLYEVSIPIVAFDNRHKKKEPRA